MVGLPSMAQKSHFWPWYGPTLRDWCAEPLCRISLIFRHACSCMSRVHVLFLFIDFRTDDEVLK